jgi:hypothetical protein
LALVANNARFLILSGYAVPNMATRVLKLTLDRVSDDWRERYQHPPAVVETFVDPERFQGTAYKAGGLDRTGNDERVRTGWSGLLRAAQQAETSVCLDAALK